MPHAPRGRSRWNARAWGPRVALALAISLASPGSASAQPAPSAPGAVRGPTSLALLQTAAGDAATTLHLVGPTAPPGSHGSALAVGPALATLPHPPLATLRAAVQGDAVLVVVDEATRGDRSFASALVRLQPGRPPARLGGALVHASRPVPRPGSREVLVSRGEVAIGAGGARVDHLRIDVIDVDTGTARTIQRARGNLLFVAGVAGSEVVTYRVDAAGAAALLAVDLTSGRERTIVPSLPPFARDFSIDEAGGTIVFQNRHETEASRWVVEQVDLGTGSASRLHEDASMQLAPHLWPDGSLALTRDPARPLERLDAGRGVRGAPTRGLSPGVTRVGAVDPARERVAVTTSLGGGLPTVALVNVKTGASTRVAVPPNARATVAGFLAPSSPPASSASPARPRGGPR